jgi:hypothetical protein
MTTRDAVQRWQSVLRDIEAYGMLPSGQNVRQKLAGPEARAHVAVVNASPVYRMVQGTLTTPFIDLWTADPPRDPALLAVLQPIHDAAMAFTPVRELLPQWDHFEALVRSAQSVLETEPRGEPTIDEILSEMLLALRTTLLLAGIGLHGAMKVIAEELVRRQISFASSTTRALRFYDFATGSMADSPSATTLRLEGLKAIVGHDESGTISDQRSPAPHIVKHFAAQSIVDFFTDWEEYYRVELARVHGCSRHDFQIEYFGDLSKIRQDYVHNRGLCRNSARCRTLKWFAKGQLMVPTSENYLQLLTDFPEAELRNPPAPRDSIRVPATGQVPLGLMREFEQIANDKHGNTSAAMELALSEWISTNRPNRK